MFVEWKHGEKISFAFFSPSMLIGKYVQNVVVFFSPFGFYCSVECYIYIYIYIYTAKNLLYASVA